MNNIGVTASVVAMLKDYSIDVNDNAIIQFRFLLVPHFMFKVNVKTPAYEIYESLYSYMYICVLCQNFYVNFTYRPCDVRRHVMRDRGVSWMLGDKIS